MATPIMASSHRRIKKRNWWLGSQKGQASLRTCSIRETILMQEAQISGSFGRCTHASSSSSPSKAKTKAKAKAKAKGAGGRRKVRVRLTTNDLLSANGVVRFNVNLSSVRVSATPTASD